MPEKSSVRDEFLDVGDPASFEEALKGAHVLKGTSSFTSSRKKHLNAVFNQHLILEWQVSGNAIMIINPAFAEDIISHAGLETRKMDTSMFSKSLGDDYLDMKNGKVALELVKHGVTIAYMIRKEEILSILQKLKKQQAVMTRNLTRIENVLSEAVVRGRGIDIEFNADGSMSVKIDGANVPSPEI